MNCDPAEWGQVLNAQGYIPTRRQSRFALGLDLGQANDFTAICAVERISGEPKLPLEVRTDLHQVTLPPRFEVRHLQRLPLQTSYPAVVNYVASLLSRPPLAGNCKLVIDATGVGRPVADLFAACKPCAVTITAGSDESRAPDGWGYRVSKLILISRLQALLHTGALKISKKLPEAGVLAAELADFRPTITEAGHLMFGARSGKHDDLVLSLALACWWLCGPRGSGQGKVLPLEL